MILLLLWLLFLRRLLYNRFTRSWRRIGSVSVLTYVPHFVLMEKQEYFYKKDFCKISYYIIRDMDRVSENLSFFGFGSAVLWHSGPQNSKKSRPKKLVKTNKSIKWIFELGKSSKLPKMQFHVKMFLIYLLSRVFCLDFFKFSSPLANYAIKMVGMKNIVYLLRLKKLRRYL